jgi:8-oxo-dGTP pyrophosphatase MutT (NUDIX family)
MPISSHCQQLRNKIGHELLQIPGVAAVIHDEAGRILLQQNTGDRVWSLPAGSIEPGEAPAQAVVREVWEETSLKVRPVNENFSR